MERRCNSHEVAEKAPSKSLFEGVENEILIENGLKPDGTGTKMDQILSEDFHIRCQWLINIEQYTDIRGSLSMQVGHHHSSAEILWYNVDAPERKYWF